jgi:peptidoglycan/LPS O-acetylase OafA/YrhL
METKHPHFTNLDPLRFFAFAAVFISHLTYFLRYPVNVTVGGTWPSLFLQIGDVAVWFFFALSGFLITFLLLRERNVTHSISIKSFYFRRILRIWPAYFTAIFLAVVVSFVARGSILPYRIDIDWSWISPFFIFIGNISRAYHGSVNEMLSVLWSLAVEQQYYLIWPVLLLIFRKKIHYVVIAGIITSGLFRYFAHPTYEVRSFSTLSVMCTILIGSWCALEFERIKSWSSSAWFKYVRILSPVFIIALLWFRGSFVNQTIGPDAFFSIEQTMFAFFFVVIIADQAIVDKPVLPMFGRFKPLVFLGKISYGLYVYHIIALTLVLVITRKSQAFSGPEFFILFGLTATITIVLAVVSYYFIERPFLKLKRWLF